MDIQLLKANESDAERMLEIQRMCFKAHYERYHDDAGSPYTESSEKMLFKIAFKNGAYYKIVLKGTQIGGVRVVKKDGGHYRIGIIYVLPEFQGKGIGQKAILMAEALYPEAEDWELDCPEDLPSNRHCYEKLGYKTTGEKEVVNEKLTLIHYLKLKE